MKVRSRGLGLLGVGLLATAGALGAVLVHDGEGAASPLAAAEPGDAVLLKGAPQPFYPTSSLAAWALFLPVLQEHNFTYVLADDAGVVALLAANEPAPDDVVLTEGTVTLVGSHPDGSGRLLVVVHVTGWRSPLLFR